MLNRIRLILLTFVLAVISRPPSVELDSTDYFGLGTEATSETDSTAFQLHSEMTLP